MLGSFVCQLQAPLHRRFQRPGLLCVSARQAGVLMLFSISASASPGLPKRWGAAPTAFLATYPQHQHHQGNPNALSDLPFASPGNICIKEKIDILKAINCN